MSSGITINLNIYGADNQTNPAIKVTGTEMEQISLPESGNMEMPPVPVESVDENNDFHAPPSPSETFTTVDSETEANFDPGFPPFAEQEENSLSNTSFVAPPEVPFEDTADDGFTFTAPGIPQGALDEPENLSSQPSLLPDATFAAGINQEDNYPAPPEPE